MKNIILITFASLALIGCSQGYNKHKNKHKSNGVASVEKMAPSHVGNVAHESAVRSSEVSATAAKL